MVNSPESFNPQSYRDDLAEELQEERSKENGRERAREILDAARQTEEYKEAEATIKERRKAVNALLSAKPTLDRGEAEELFEQCENYPEARKRILDQTYLLKSIRADIKSNKQMQESLEDQIRRVKEQLGDMISFLQRKAEETESFSDVFATAGRQDAATIEGERVAPPLNLAADLLEDSISSEAYSRYQELKKEKGNIFPIAIEYTDDEGNPTGGTGYVYKLPESREACDHLKSKIKENRGSQSEEDIHDTLQKIERAFEIYQELEEIDITNPEKIQERFGDLDQYERLVMLNVLQGMEPDTWYYYSSRMGSSSPEDLDRRLQTMGLDPNEITEDQRTGSGTRYRVIKMSAWTDASVEVIKKHSEELPNPDDPEKEFLKRTKKRLEKRLDEKREEQDKLQTERDDVYDSVRDLIKISDVMSDENISYEEAKESVEYQNEQAAAIAKSTEALKSSYRSRVGEKTHVAYSFDESAIFENGNFVVTVVDKNYSNWQAKKAQNWNWIAITDANGNIRKDEIKSQQYYDSRGHNFGGTRHSKDEKYQKILSAKFLEDSDNFEIKVECQDGSTKTITGEMDRS
jgi:hypothetical protein